MSDDSSLLTVAVNSPEDRLRVGVCLSRAGHTSSCPNVAVDAELADSVFDYVRHVHVADGGHVIVGCKNLNAEDAAALVIEAEEDVVVLVVPVPPI
ncbi:hypothetical protein O1611_g7431 [Lasiodiplodia mahajangana]|uniref:Uncharacterized protein n=1 Tax=Lasiodiplodia mahajangana TaxID=1108764 RepID=A0ACC2JFX0_9PEZI|nr:hypothetical protein O1611_g7431 [Lasiodiplodia mahajangana]